MTHQMIEKMARAMAEDVGFRLIRHPMFVHPDAWKEFVPTATAALRALLEPTEDMVEAGAIAVDGVDMFSRFNDWTSDHVVGLPIEICRVVDDDIQIVARYSGMRERDAEQHLVDHRTDAMASDAWSAMILAILGTDSAGER